MQPQHKSAMSQAQILDKQGTAHISKGEYFLALLTLSAAVHQDPNLASAHNHRGAALAEMGELHQAVDNFNTAIRLDPANIKAHLNRGITKARLGRSQEAIQDLSDLRSQRPQDPEIHYAIGYIHSIALDHRQAIPHYTAALLINPEHTQARYNRALDYFHSGQLLRAHQEFSIAAEADPSRRPAAAHRDTLANSGITRPKGRRS